MLLIKRDQSNLLARRGTRGFAKAELHEGNGASMLPPSGMEARFAGCAANDDRRIGNNVRTHSVNRMSFAGRISVSEANARQPTCGSALRFDFAQYITSCKNQNRPLGVKRLRSRHRPKSSAEARVRTPSTRKRGLRCRAIYGLAPSGPAAFLRRTGNPAFP